ncbi:hypothetical protein AB0K18_11290 [Nonomuraea sp. NPDC049421]|uniref:hypothetical protein n=1 Tax=Nonomuraea sp. NPDC049421 TaxID=3155275 RepID=UPI003437FBF5
MPKELPPSTLNDILKGKRERLPDWGLVASFVMVCHRHAELTGLPAEALGTVQQWQERWLAARSEQPRVPAIGSFDLYRTPADEAERRTTRTVARLVRLASEGDVECTYRLAIIHLLLGEHAQARFWLHDALRKRHPDAEAFDKDPHPVMYAAQQSYNYGLAYEGEGPAKRDIAGFYYRLAADRGHPQARERLRVLRNVPFGKLLPAPVSTERLST